MKLVKVQIIRRVEDRWLGFALSQKLWYDIWPYYCMKYIDEKKDLKIYCCNTINRSFSADRIQTPVLGYIIERYENAKKSDRIIIEISDRLLRIEMSYECLDSLVLEELGIYLVEKLLLKR